MSDDPKTLAEVEPTRGRRSSWRHRAARAQRPGEPTPSPAPVHPVLAWYVHFAAAVGTFALGVAVVTMFSRTPIRLETEAVLVVLFGSGVYATLRRR